MWRDDKETYWTIQETASMLRVSSDTIYRLVRDGDMEGTKVGRQWRITSESIKSYTSGGSSNKQHNETTG